jgi:hypothetical protein
MQIRDKNEGIYLQKQFSSSIEYMYNGYVSICIVRDVYCKYVFWYKVR